MREVILTFRLMCNWRGAIPPVYRLYVNKELVTERTYIWDNSEYVLVERVPVYLTPGPHNLYIVNLNPEICKFIVEDFRVNGESRPYREVDSRFVINPEDVKV